MNKYELMPHDGHKSFYGKAVVVVDDNGTETLYSYGTPVIKRESNGELIRLWNGYSATTGRHIAAFCGIYKKAWDAMPCETENETGDGGRLLSPAESLQIMIARRGHY